MNSGGSSQDKWRVYQEGLRRSSRRRRLLRRVPVLVLLSTCVILFVLVLIHGGNRIQTHLSEASYAPSVSEEKPIAPEKKPGLQDIWPQISHHFDHVEDLKNHFSLENDNTLLTVKTTLDPSLQNYIYRILKSSNTEKAAVVVMDPEDGRILAMVSHRKNEDGGGNLCLDADFPAASLFKIVSAAAAFEKTDYTPNKSVGFQGGAHTLYKQQLKKKTNRFTTKVKFRQAFAESINPVFGKLGIYALGRGVVLDYAKKFFFNCQIPLNFPLPPSTVDMPEDRYGLAELTCGFNRDTRISPLHAAMLASAVANKGVVMKPWIVSEISRGTGPLYHAHASVLGTPIKPDTARNLQILMEDTVRYGTCSKSFLRMRRKKRFRSIDIGAKTGTINDRSERYKYDWIAAYALPKDGSAGISLAVLEVHGKILGTRAREIARAIINFTVQSKS
jgi:peptidoglycan glycosyltransferase